MLFPFHGFVEVDSKVSHECGAGDSDIAVSCITEADVGGEMSFKAGGPA